MCMYVCDREKSEDSSIAALGSRLSANVKSQQTAPGFELLSLREKKVTLLPCHCLLYILVHAARNKR